MATNGTLDVQGKHFINRGGKITAAGTTFTGVKLSEAFDNTNGLLVASGDMSIAAVKLINRKDHIEHGGDGKLAVAVGALEGRAGTLVSAGDITLTADMVDLSGATTQGKSIGVNVGTLTYAAGKLMATGDKALKLHVREGFNNINGAIGVSGALDLEAKGLINKGGEIKSAGTDALKLTVAATFDNANGKLLTAGNIDLTARHVINEGGSIVAAGQSSLTTTIVNTLDNSAEGRLASGGDMALKAAVLDNLEGHVQHSGEGNLAIDAATATG